MEAGGAARRPGRGPPGPGGAPRLEPQLRSSLPQMPRAEAQGREPLHAPPPPPAGWAGLTHGRETAGGKEGEARAEPRPQRALCKAGKPRPSELEASPVRGAVVGKSLSQDPARGRGLGGMGVRGRAPPLNGAERGSQRKKDWRGKVPHRPRVGRPQGGGATGARRGPPPPRSPSPCSLLGSGAAGPGLEAVPWEGRQVGRKAPLSSPGGRRGPRAEGLPTCLSTCLSPRFH